MITIDVDTLHTLLVLAREATRAREAAGDLAVVPALSDCHGAIENGAALIEAAFAVAARGVARAA